MCWMRTFSICNVSIEYGASFSRALFEREREDTWQTNGERECTKEKKGVREGELDHSLMHFIHLSSNLSIRFLLLFLRLVKILIIHINHFVNKRPTYPVIIN